MYVVVLFNLMTMIRVYLLHVEVWLKLLHVHMWVCGTMGFISLSLSEGIEGNTVHTPLLALHLLFLLLAQYH